MNDVSNILELWHVFSIFKHQNDTLPKFNSEFSPEKLPFHPIGKEVVFFSPPFLQG